MASPRKKATETAQPVRRVYQPSLPGGFIKRAEELMGRRVQQAVYKALGDLQFQGEEKGSWDPDVREAIMALLQNGYDTHFAVRAQYSMEMVLEAWLQDGDAGVRATIQEEETWQHP
jgi:hypothetical protein